MTFICSTDFSAKYKNIMEESLEFSYEGKVN
jgi:hypothetical protein